MKFVSFEERKCTKIIPNFCLVIDKKEKKEKKKKEPTFVAC